MKSFCDFKDSENTFDLFAIFTVFVGCHVPVTVYCVPMNVQVICRSVLTEALCLHFLYFCVHLYSFHSLVYLPFMTFFLLYHNRLACTLPGEILYIPFGGFLYVLLYCLHSFNIAIKTKNSLENPPKYAIIKIYNKNREISRKFYIKGA